MAETSDEQKAPDELKGKNITHYSVMLAAYINSRVEANKAVFGFSSAAIGLLIGIDFDIQSKQLVAQYLYIGALLAFFVAVASTLFVHVRHAKSIESYIRGEGNENSMDFKLKKWKYVNYLSFALGVALALGFKIVDVIGC